MAARFWRRHRNAVLTAAAIGGTASLCAGLYYWWKGDQERSQQQQQDAWDSVLDALTSIMDGESRRHLGSHTAPEPERLGADSTSAAASELPAVQPSTSARSSSASSGRGAPVEQSAGSDSLQGHFASMQELNDKQALEGLLPRLKEVVMSATDAESAKELIKASPSDDDAAAAEKMVLWRQLARNSFTRAMSACWLVALLDLLVRLKLHIVGRHMYLESRLPQMQPSTPNRPRPPKPFPVPATPAGRVQAPPRLSERAKEEFFRSDYFIAVGAIGIIHKMRMAVDRVLANVDFNTLMSPADVERMVIDMNAHFEAGFERFDDLWHKYLLPPGQQPISIRTPSGVEAFMSPIEAAMVDELNQELRDATADYRFLLALRAAVRHTSRITGAYISSKLKGSRSAERLAEHAPGSPCKAAEGPAVSPDTLPGNHAAALVAYGARAPTPPPILPAPEGSVGRVMSYLALPPKERERVDRQRAQQEAQQQAQQTQQQEQQAQQGQQEASGSGDGQGSAAYGGGSAAQQGPGGDSSDRPGGSSEAQRVGSSGAERQPSASSRDGDVAGGGGGAQAPGSTDRQASSSSDEPSMSGGGGREQQASAGGTGRQGADGNGRQHAPQARPFVFIVPVVGKSCLLLFDQANRITKGISSLQPVQALCAAVFTFTPHIC